MRETPNGPSHHAKLIQTIVLKPQVRLGDSPMTGEPPGWTISNYPMIISVLWIIHILWIIKYLLETNPSTHKSARREMRQRSLWGASHTLFSKSLTQPFPGQREGRFSRIWLQRWDRETSWPCLMGKLWGNYGDMMSRHGNYRRLGYRILRPNGALFWTWKNWAPEWGSPCNTGIWRSRTICL